MGRKVPKNVLTGIGPMKFSVTPKSMLSCSLFRGRVVAADLGGLLQVFFRGVLSGVAIIRNDRPGRGLAGEVNNAYLLELLAEGG